MKGIRRMCTLVENIMMVPLDVELFDGVMQFVYLDVKPLWYFARARGGGRFLMQPKEPLSPHFLFSHPNRAPPS